MRLLKIFILLVSLCVTTSSSFALSKQVNTTITLGPCSMAINGTVTYTLLPPAITGFHGTITFGNGCTGTITCAIVPNTDAKGNIVSLTYTFEDGSDPEDEQLIQTDSYNQAMIDWFNQQQQELQS